MALLEATGEYATPRVAQLDDPLHAAAFQMFGAGVVLVAAGTALGEPARLRPADIGLPAAAAFAFLVLVGSVLAYPALVWLLQTVPPGTAATYAYVNPVVALALGWVLLDQTVPAVALLGTAVVLASVVVVVSRTARPAPAGPPGPTGPPAAPGAPRPAAARR